MKKIIFFASLVLFSCSSKEKDEVVKLDTFKDKLSYALGADHARSIAESGDRNYENYDLAEIEAGFKAGLGDQDAFDEGCKNTLQELFGETGREFKKELAKKGSLCIGKLSSMFFYESWNRKNAMSRLDKEKLILGFRAGLNKADSLVSRGDQATLIQNFIADLNKINGSKMLEAAQKKPHTQTTASGLVLETLVEGTGGKPEPGDDVLAHYILINAQGDTLQSSYEMVEKYQQELTPFSLLSVAPGWQEGLPMMNQGGKYHLYLPFHLGYGAEGMFNQQSQRFDIQPYESLKFYIELLKYGKPGTIK